MESDSAQAVDTVDKVLRGWGMLFRSIFIPIVGYVGYQLLDPHSIGDVPFSELTLNSIFSNVFATLLVLGCLCWFFSFPEDKKLYETWGTFGVLFVLGAVAVIFYF